MTAGARAEARQRESRWLATLMLLLCLTGVAMSAMTVLAWWGWAARPWPPIMATAQALTMLGIWILILSGFAARRALWLTRESAEILREKRRREELVEAFDARARALAGVAASQELYEATLDAALELLDADTGSLMLVGMAEKQLTIVAARGLSDDIIRTSRIQFGDRIAGLVAETGRPLLLGSGPAPAQVAPRLERQHELSSSVCVPLLSGDVVVGVLSLNRLQDRPPFAADDLESIGLLAERAEAHLADRLPAATDGSEER